MWRSVSGVAPMIIWVLCPAGAKGWRAPVDAPVSFLLWALCTAICPMGRRMAVFFLVRGQLPFRLASLGSSILTERRSASRPMLLHQQRVRAGDGLGVDVAVEVVFLPQDAQCLDHQLHRAVGRAQHRAGQEQPLNIVAAVKPDGQIGQFPRGKSRPRAVVGSGG